mmetsp:Transcript_28167/g.76048  ORF Transcript_28167/g.76048 Transcript_28167/m.76048 type:complete len:210 (-) Transcript_28167:263-892(-)
MVVTAAIKAPCLVHFVACIIQAAIKAVGEAHIHRVLVAAVNVGARGSLVHEPPLCHFILFTHSLVCCLTLVVIYGCQLLGVARGIVNLGEGGNVVRPPVSSRQHVGHVSCLNHARQLLHHPQQPGRQALLGLKLLQIYHHVLVVVGAAVLVLEDAEPLLTTVCQQQGCAHTLPAQQSLCGQSGIHIGVEDVICRLQHDEAGLADVKVIV